MSALVPKPWTINILTMMIRNDVVVLEKAVGYDSREFSYGMASKLRNQSELWVCLSGVVKTFSVACSETRRFQAEPNM